MATAIPHTPEGFRPRFGAVPDASLRRVVAPIAEGKAPDMFRSGEHWGGFESQEDLTYFLPDEHARDGLRFCRIDASRSDLWASALDGFETACVFHEPAWTFVLKEAFGFDPLYCVLHREGAAVAGLLLVPVPCRIGRSRGVSLPFTDFCPLLWRDSAVVQPFRQAIHRMGRSRGWDYVELRDNLPRHDHEAPSVAFYSHRVDLTPGVQEVFARLKPEVRTAIRKGRRYGLQTGIETSLDAMKEFYQLYLGTRKKHGIPPQHFRLFAAIHRHLVAKGLGAVVLARKEGRPVAGGVFLLARGQALFKYGASEPRELHCRGNDLVMWEAIEWCIAKGARSLHLGRTSIRHHGLRRFKLGWGSQEQDLHYFRRSCLTGQVLPVADRASGMIPRVLRHLPTFVLRALGATVYRHSA